MKIIIRKLRKEDKKEILLLKKEFSLYNRKEMLSERISFFEALSDIDKFIEIEFEKALKSVSFVAESNGEIVGFIEGEVKQAKERVFDKIGYINEFFVTDEQRQKGIGKMLFNNLRDEFKHLGCRILKTSSYIDNKMSIKLYMKLGFIKETVSFVKEI